MLKKVVLFKGVILLCLIFCGCSGGSDDNDNDTPPGGGDSPIAISGLALAPGGAVAFRSKLNFESIAESVVNFLVPSVYAGVTDFLDPVGGATVELIRIDNDGNQIGDVLATTVTSVTGNYELELPTGVDLSGDLIVRITGNGADMRAQVVELEVDINPATEFVLDQFIDSNLDLATLESDAVVNLVGQVEEFDLTQTADLGAVLEELQAMAGGYIQDQIELIASVPGDVSTIAGNYYGDAFQFALHDDELAMFGTFAHNIGVLDINLADGGDGIVNGTLISEEDATTNLRGSDGGNTFLNYETDIEQGNTFTINYTEDGALFLQSEFEEDIDGDFGFRFLPNLTVFQQALNGNAFFGTTARPIVRFETIDTNGDGTPDAVDPGAKSGDEWEGDFVHLLKPRAGLTSADLSGDYGRVFIGVETLSSGIVEAELGVNVVTFSGSNTLSVSEDDQLVISRDSFGNSNIEMFVDPAEADIPFTVNGDGTFDTIGGEPATGAVSNDLQLVSVLDSDGIDGQQGFMGKTLLLKLPTTAPNPSNKTYRIVSSLLGMVNDALLITLSRPADTMSFDSEGTATITSSTIVTRKPFLQGSQITALGQGEPNNDTTVTIASNGATTITVNTPIGVITFNGFFNADASLGIFRAHFASANNPALNSIGLSVFVEK